MPHEQKPRVFFVDDEKDLAASLAAKYSKDYATEPFTSPQDALSRVDESVAVVVADQVMPLMTGVELLAKLRSKSPDTVRILLTAFADLIPLLQLINEAKVFHYIPKTPRFPDNMNDVLADAVDLYHLRQQRRRKLAQLQAQLRLRTSEERCFEDLLGDDPKLQEAIRMGRWAATHDRPVLITGETGTGKDVLARAIHFSSRRAQGPLRVVNCGLLRPELAQVALFGREKGAYTGATETDAGIIRKTDGGTLFLNEIGELHKEVQTFFLTFLDDGDIEPVGHSGPNPKANVRIIAATNRDVASWSHSAEEKFRLDLFHRISGRPIHLPPLRERRADIPVLVRHAAIAAAAKFGLDSVPIGGEALAHLQSLPYPGNVRELMNTVDRAVDSVKMNGDTNLELKHVRDATLYQPHARGAPTSLREAEAAFRRQFVETALNRNHTRIAAAAELGITDRYLRDLIKEFGISKEE